MRKTSSSVITMLRQPWLGCCRMILSSGWVQNAPIQGTFRPTTLRRFCGGFPTNLKSACAHFIDTAAQLALFHPAPISHAFDSPKCSPRFANSVRRRRLRAPRWPLRRMRRRARRQRTRSSTMNPRTAARPPSFRTRRTRPSLRIRLACSGQTSANAVAASRIASASTSGRRVSELCFRILIASIQASRKFLQKEITWSWRILRVYSIRPAKICGGPAGCIPPGAIHGIAPGARGFAVLRSAGHRRLQHPAHSSRRQLPCLVL